MYPVGKKLDNQATCQLHKKHQAGYSLIETIIVVIILSILATVTVRSLRNSSDITRTNRTSIKLEQLAIAITGDPDLISGGSRVDFGFIGDIGALPTNLTALITNPGFTTWDGPYLHSEFSLTGSSENLLNDAWGKSFVYSGSITISSSGGGFPMTRSVASSSAELLANQIRLTILDADLSPPGSANVDSVRVEIHIPNGLGAMTTVVANPAGDGSASFSSIPIGRHLMEIIYLPDADTLRRQLSIEPSSLTSLEIQFPTDLW